jgi:hypothetical protein
MQILAAVQVIITAAFLMAGLFTLFGVGITGLILVVPAVAFAAAAGVSAGRSKGAVMLALTLDAVLAYFSATKVQEYFDPTDLIARFGAQAAAAMRPKPIELIVPTVALVLVAAATLAAILDWRKIKASPWF